MSSVEEFIKEDTTVKVGESFMTLKEYVDRRIVAILKEVHNQ